MTRCLLIGNYGDGNAGDEALRAYFEKTFPVEWQVLSAHPQGNDLPRLPMGIRSFLSMQWLKTLRAIRACDHVVFGGGTLFTDIESIKACLLWGLHAFVAVCFRKPIHLAFQGVGPFKTALGQGIARWIYRHATTISVRDTASADRVAAFQVNTEIVQTFDPVFSSYFRENRGESAQNVFIIIPRKNSGETFENLVRSTVPPIGDVEILLFEPDDAGERAAAGRLQTKIPRATVVPIASFDDAAKHISAASNVVSHRYHGGIVALALGVPVDICMQQEGDKLSQLMPYAKGDRNREELQGLVQKGEVALRRALL